MAEARAGLGLVEAAAARDGLRALLGSEPRSVVVDADLKPATRGGLCLRPRMRGYDYAHLGAGPFRSVVEQIAQHLLQVLALALEARSRGAIECVGEVLVAVETLQRTNEGFRDR